MIVGGRHSIVGSAFGTWRSIANCLRAGDVSSASIRRCGVPTIVNVRLQLGRATAVVLATDAREASAPKPML